jgi:hypothetical protein
MASAVPGINKELGASLKPQLLEWGFSSGSTITQGVTYKTNY